MTNRFIFTSFFTFCTIIIAIAQKTRIISSARYIAPHVIIGHHPHTVCPSDVSTIGIGSFSDENDNNSEVSSSTIDSISPFLRLAELTPQTTHIEWHFPSNDNISTCTFTLRKNNTIVYSTSCSAQTSFLNIPTPTLSQGDVLQINVQRGTLNYELNAVFVTSLLTPFLATGNAPLPMATVEIVHPRKGRATQRTTPNNIAGQCLYVHDAESTTAAYYRTTDILSILNTPAINLTDSLYSVAIAGKTAYITYDNTYGNCNNNDNDNSSRSTTNISQVYPNPSEASFHIHYESEKPSDIKVTVSDLQGREVFSYQANKESEGDHQVTIENLPKGVYIYFVQKDNQIQRGTLVKQ